MSHMVFFFHNFPVDLQTPSMTIILSVAQIAPKRASDVFRLEDQEPLAWFVKHAR